VNSKSMLKHYKGLLEGKKQCEYICEGYNGFMFY
jgi:hypothetical protein